MYYDLLAKIKNAGLARKESFETSYSKADFRVAQILVDAGYLKDVAQKTLNKKTVLEVKVAYRNRAPVMSDFKVISKPSRRLYSGYRKLMPVKQNYGLAILSTPEGLMTNREARKKKVGGEYLFQIW